MVRDYVGHGVGREFHMPPQIPHYRAKDSSARVKAERELAYAISAILSHPVFQSWIKDSAFPKHFRDAGHFWGVAPGTPPAVIRERIAKVDQTLTTAFTLLTQQNVDEIGSRHGKALFGRSDVERAASFQRTLKERFERDLQTLQVSLT